VPWDLADAVARREQVAAASLEDFDAELPVPLTEFVQSPRYLANPPLSPVQYEAVQYAERVYFPATYRLLASVGGDTGAYWSQDIPMVNFLTMQWGKGAGKDHTSRIMSLRVVYLLLCLKSPQAYFGMPEQDTIHVLNVASSAGQASRAFFAPLRRAVSRPGNWFQDISEAVVASSARRRESAKALLNLVRFDKNVEAVSGHSDADTQEGLNLILGVADEVDGFKSRAELERERGARQRESASSAEAILQMLQTSASTRFPEVYKNVRISYPRYLGSTIQKLTAQAREDNARYGKDSRHYVSGPLATWDVNPRVSRENYKQDYRDDPVLAQAKYECKPSRAVNPYFSNEIALRACSLRVEHPPLVVSGYARDANSWYPLYNFSRELKPIRGANYGIHADLAKNGDRAGVAMSHIRKMEEITVLGVGPKGEDVPLTESRPRIRVDFACAYSSDASAVPPREIQLRWFRMLVLDLRRRGFNIRLASCDGYNSVDTFQVLEAHGIPVKIQSTDRTEQHWQSLRDLAYEGRLEMALDELLLGELLGLSRLPNGKIDHLGDSSKDVADAVACSISDALEVGGQEDPDGGQAWPGGDLQSWTGASAGFEDYMPIGFQRPRLLLPIGVEHPDSPYESAAAAQELDERGLPRMWMPNMFEDDPMGCPCSAGDGVPRCRECKTALAGGRQQ
jgi:hypothetical protein